MNQIAATNLIAKTFNSKFDDQEFEQFVANLLNKVDRSKAFRHVSGSRIKKKYHGHISTYRRPFVYYDPNGDRLDVLIVKLHKKSNLERARTMQRNFAADYLKRDHDQTVEAALIAFYHEDVDDWRFSLVKLEYAFGDEGFEERLTPARRYSFLVGPTEPTHTAEEQLHPFLKEDSKKPTIEQITAAFQIETVSKQFFDEYKNLFLGLVEGVEAVIKDDKMLAADFERADIYVPNFTKKLLGQIVFLYFVQKKGWLGVDVDKKWGSGPKDFLRHLFEKEDGVAYDNFFNDVLEPLFYDALAVRRAGDLFPIAGGFECKIPFLNGGLFEPMGGYDWAHTKLLLPNSLFSNRQNAEDDEGTGILDVFDRYNFTVWEEEPLEKEVAVDPEMLGKVFENLLDVQDRKSKGAFYTPREIVHYMCQESLINYLDTSVNVAAKSLVDEKPVQEAMFGATKPQNQMFKTMQRTEIISRDDIGVLVRQGALALQHDAAKEAGLKKDAYILPANVRGHAAALDTALADIKICDPAIGSGAFPVGMLHEIVQARLALDTQLKNTPTPYQLKRHAIQESIYGVDIDDGAVDIAKLRLWLSLVVDEESYDNIQPLPNLDYKIVRGNSLVGFPANWNSPAFTKLEELKHQYFSETDSDKKELLKIEADNQIRARLAKSEQVFGYKIDFDFKLFFSEVFHYKGGFDVVIGNPPYLRIQGIRKKHPELAKQYKKLYKSATGSFDLYVLFTERGLGILGNKGQLNFIMPDKWTNAAFGKGLRNVISKNKYGHKLISFGAHQIFNASTYTSLIWLTKYSNKRFMYFSFNQDLLTDYELGISLNNLRIEDFNPIETKNLTVDAWVLTNRSIGAILDKMGQQSRRLSQIFSKIFQGIATSKDSVYFLTDCTQQGDLITGYSKELDDRVTVEIGLMKPLLKGNQVHRYVHLKSDNFVLFPYRLHKQNGKDLAEIMTPTYIQENFPQGWKYLLACEKAIKGRERGRLAKDKDWYRYIYPKNSTLFQLEKLVCPDISMGGNFTYDTNGQFYMTTTVYGYVKYPDIAESYNFWLALMNSKLLWFYLRNTGTVLANGYFRYKPAYLERFPVPERINPVQEVVFVTLVDYISYIKKNIDIKSMAHARDAVMVNYFEQLLDALIYELYFAEELYAHERYFMRLAQKENFPSLDELQEAKIRHLRQIFERIFDRNHSLRQNLFFLDSLPTIRIIEGKE